MKNILVCWIGFTDLRAVTESETIGLGPIAQAAKSKHFDEIVLISDRPKDEMDSYVCWLQGFTQSEIFLKTEPLSGPTRFGEIYEAAVRVVTDTLQRHPEKVALTFHLSPGTPAMAAVWIILSKTRFPAELIESSKEFGVQIASVPFDISAEFIPDLLRRPDERLEKLTAGLPPEAPEFDSIVHRGHIMKRVIAKARHVAPRSVPVLIEGESGTGKELLARAIHKASPRRDNPFVAVNCGAIPSELVESELFGHEKGAFTGADKQKIGYFESADKGTLFLDEIGELPMPSQVKLLRALQEKEVVRIGATAPVKFDVRVIAATNKNLIDEVTAGCFRKDLFYRIAVAVLKLPPLRERSGDFSLLIDKLLDQINIECVDEPGYKNKNISASAKNFMMKQIWPGNIRELQNTLLQAAIWSTDTTIDIEDIRESMLPMANPNEDRLLDRPMKDGINLPELMEKLAQHYLKRALDEANGNKTRATELVGLPSYQTFSNWLKKYHIE
uniref:Sigma-54-dependent Fis family transcriptional regulator n=1 Tax=Candidatus Desulfatibia profunda TaxID=2841695 RepID=A0A8J6NV89_9BACT|nr:sigma-54-dependent Fis family transcriptional regulator [Candidatus Desulfatibia profunda]